MKEKLKSFLFVLGFLSVALLLDYTRRACGIPVTILDLLLFPGTLIFMFVILRDFFVNQKKEKKGKSEKPGASSIAGRIAAALLLFFPLGIWCLWEGVRNPLDYFSGVKGAAHGYTLIPLGLFIFGMGVMLLVSVVRIFKENKE